MTNLEGQTFAGYEILAKLGQGGMGAVYKARQPKLDRLIALKIMATELATDADFVARFKREASAAAALNHEGIVQVFAAGESEGTHFIAMEFVEGETLRHHIENQGKLDPREAIAVTIRVAQALDHAWNKARVIHRDIKPENIFLSNTGEVKVGDLGLAKTVGGGSTSLTQTGMMMGSPHYISPEQARGLGDIDFRTDIYSLGCTLYHMLTGRPPYTGTDPLVVINKHVNEPPPAIFKVWPTCPIPLALLVGKMLAKQRHERPANYEDLIEQLHEVREKLKPATTVAPVSASEPTQVLPTPAPAQPAQPTPKPVVTKTPTVAPKARGTKPATRDSRLVIGGAVAAAVLLLGGLFLWSPWRTEPGSESRLQAEAVSGQPAKAGTPNATFSATENWQDFIAEARRSGSIPNDFKDDGSAWVRSGGTVTVLAKSIRDGAVRVTFTFPDGKLGNVGLNLRYDSSAGRGYQGSVSPSRVTVVRTEHGERTTIATGTLPARFDPKQEITLEFRVVGDELNCKLNGQTVVTCRDSTFSREGQAALYCRKMGTRFSRIEVLNLDGAKPLTSNAPPVIANWEDVMPMVRAEMDKTGAVRHEAGWTLATEGVSGMINLCDRSLANVAVRGRFREACGVLLAFGGRPLSRYYSFVLRRDGGYLDLCRYVGSEDKNTLEIKRLTDLRSSTANEHDFLITKVGEQLSVWMDGTFAGSVQDDTATSGKVRMHLRPGHAIRDLAIADLGAAAPASADAGWQNAINLLPLIDPQKDAVVGEWTLANGELKSSTTGGWARMQIPYQPPEEYDFLIVFARQKGAGATYQMLTGGGRPFALCIAATKQGRITPKYLGFEVISGKSASENPTAALLGPDLEYGRHYTSLVQVRKDGVKAFLDGRFITEWKTDYRDVSIHNSIRMRDDRLLGIGTSSSGGIIFHRIEVREVTGKGTFTRGAPATADAGWQNAINLLPLIDPQKDAVLGHWTLENGNLKVDHSGAARLQIPYQPPEEYDFRIVFSRQTNKNVLWQILTRNGHAFAWCVAANQGRSLGFDRVGGKGVGDNPTSVTMSQSLENGRRYTSSVEVRKGGVRGFFDGRFISEWKTDYRDVTLADWLTLRDERSLGIGSGANATTFHAVEVREVTGKGTFTRGAPSGASQQPRQTIDLLALTDHEKDSVITRGSGGPGRWAREGQALAYLGGSNGKLAAPVAIHARNYEIEVEFERQSDKGRFHVDLPLSANRLLPICIGRVRTIVGNAGETCPEPAKGRNRVIVRMERGEPGGPDHVIVRFNGALVTDWRGDTAKHASDTEPYPEFTNQPRPALFTYFLGYKFTAWTLRIFDGEATMLRGASNTPTLPPSTASAPWLSAFCAEVAALPAEQQVARVVAKLKELNPGFDGKETHKIEKSAVTELTFSTVAVADISPVRALSGLKNLICQGEAIPGRSGELRKGLLADLSPLRGLKLESLSCSRNRIVDLEPLTGMPLWNFTSYFNYISDLKPLASTPLRCLFLSGNNVSDLSPLKGMSLQRLMCHERQVRDLSPIAGMPLKTLSVMDTSVTDLSPLRGMRLENVSLWKAQTDFALLADMPLKEIQCEFSPQRDTALLRSIKTLKTINKLPAEEFWKLVAAGKAPNFKGEVQDAPTKP